MTKTKVIVACEYGGTEDVQEIIQRSFLLYLQRELINPFRIFTDEVQATVPLSR